MDYISLEDMAAQLALILSELHVPTRARDLAEQFKNLLTVRQNIKTLDKVHHVLATENSAFLNRKKKKRKDLNYNKFRSIKENQSGNVIQKKTKK
ncbi:hypothetical protein RFI_35696, partial [Reticulomyxa filosa]